MNSTASDTKVCTKCNQELPLSAYPKHKPSPLGLHPRCRACKKVSDAECYQRNRERRRAEGRAWYEKNRERVSESGKLYRIDNAEKVKERRKARYRANPEQAKARAKAWLKENKERAAKRRRQYAVTHRDLLNALSRKYAREKPEVIRAHKKNNKVKRRNAPGYCSPEQWLAKIEYHGSRCLYCKTPLTSETMHMEHRKPLARGGSQWPANLAPACAPCNLRKNAKTEAEFKAAMRVEDSTFNVEAQPLAEPHAVPLHQ